MISSEKAKTRKEAVFVKLYTSFHVVPVSQALNE